MEIFVVSDDEQETDKFSAVIQQAGFSARPHKEAYQNINAERAPNIVLLVLSANANSKFIVSFLNHIHDSAHIIALSHDAISVQDIKPLLQRKNTRIISIDTPEKQLVGIIQQQANKFQQQIFPDFLHHCATDYDHYLHGNSVAVQELRQNLLQAANGNSRVLLNGPIGTGKLMMASHIHANSGRKNAPIALYQCGNKQNQNTEETLFGKEDGAGNIISVGLLERTHGGSLILDKIELMPIFLQQKMARLLQQNTLQRLAGSNNIKIDTRIIATIGSDIEQAIQDNQLDRNFYQRVGVLEISLPSLAERRTDIIDITNYFNAKWAKFYGTHQLTIFKPALDIIERYNWQGNLFALSNFIERLYLRDSSRTTQFVSDSVVEKMLNPSGDPIDTGGTSGFLLQKFKLAKENFEKYYLSYQLQRYGGNISQTAKMIGVDRVSLHRKIRNLSLTAYRKDLENQE